MAIAGGLLHAKVFHKRYRPIANAFTYKVFYLCLPLSQLEQARLPVLGIDRFNLMSFYHKDHGARDGSDIRPWIRDMLAKGEVSAADGEIWLVAYPRIFGYVFNPVSFWFCLDKAGSLRAVLAEVNNTFGERHCYLISHPDQRVISPDEVFHSEKVFHVSPFFHVRGRYEFRFSYSERSIGVVIDYFEGDDKVLATSVGGQREALTSLTLLKIFVMLPLVTLKTIGLIHWQAAKLWIRGVKYVPKPPPPTQGMTR